MGQLYNLLRQAIIDGIDQDTGVALSGGIDSATVCKITQEVAALLSYEPPYTFTGFYDVPGYDEREYAQLVAGPRHKWIRITPQDVIDVFDDVARFAPRPIQGPGMIGQYLVARAASYYVDKLFSGEGADELFGGYARLMSVAGETMPTGYEHYILPIDYPETLEEALRYDYARLPDLLAVDDAMCAAWHLKAEAPFADDRVVDWALKLAPADRVGKKILRKEMRALSIVPDAILDRRDKMGFPIPLVHWAHEGPLRDFFMDRIGYVPLMGDRYGRSWWNELVESARVGV